MREYPPGLGIPHEQVCDQTLYLLVGMLVIGLVCKLLVRPLADTWFMSPAGLAEEKRLAHDRAVAADVGPGTQPSTGPAARWWCRLGARWAFRWPGAWTARC